jgi:hypothetical protein
MRHWAGRPRSQEGSLHDREDFMKNKIVVAAALALCAAAALWGQTFALKAPIAQKPAFLTSVGQSADLEMVKVLLDRISVPYKADAQAKAGDLAASGAKSLILVLGGSTKGLGAAGVSAEAEIDRARALIAEAKKLGLPILGLHVGGEARRGELSDKFIQAAVPACNYVVAVAEGDKDGFITRLCGAKIPFDKVERISKAVEPLQKAFK